MSIKTCFPSLVWKKLTGLHIALTLPQNPVQSLLIHTHSSIMRCSTAANGCPQTFGHIVSAFMEGLYFKSGPLIKDKAALIPLCYKLTLCPLNFIFSFHASPSRLDCIALPRSHFLLLLFKKTLSTTLILHLQPLCFYT